jgi:hypothetical protein
MQLGKLAPSKKKQRDSCKTAAFRPKSDQRVTSEKQNSSFDPLEHSVYIGRQRLGHYKRIAKRKYAAYDAMGRLLGRFTKLANARKAFDGLIFGGER